MLSGVKMKFGGSEISHIECKNNENNEIFLTLFLQLLIEYEVMFDYIEKNSDILQNTLSNLTKNNFSNKKNSNPFTKDNQIDNLDI